jgi:hypothetical protein
MNGGELSKKAFYVPKRDVVEVELKNGNKINPANGYWVKKDAKPIEDSSSSKSASSSNKPTTRLRKDARGNWMAETEYSDHNGYDWRLITHKNFKGNLITSVQAGKIEETGTKGVKMWKYTVYQDPHYTLIVTTPKRTTEKVVSEQHDKGVEIFEAFMQTGEFKYGGKISNFEKLSLKVAKQYVGKPVKSEYQEEFGKFYSEEEAKEVGDKVAGKVKAQQADKKFFGGLMGKKEETPKKVKVNLKGKQVKTKEGKTVQILSHDDDNYIKAVYLNKITSGAPPMRLKLSDLDETSFMNGGSLPKQESNNKFKQAIALAKEIRKDGESWQSALKRAFAELKK